MDIKAAKTVGLVVGSVLFPTLMVIVPKVAFFTRHEDAVCGRRADVADANLTEILRNFIINP
jgi:hypothetical protein